MTVKNLTENGPKLSKIPPCRSSGRNNMSYFISDKKKKTQTKKLFEVKKNE